MTTGALCSGVHRVEEIVLHFLCQFAQGLCLFVCLASPVWVQSTFGGMTVFLHNLLTLCAEHGKQSGEVVSSLTNAYPSGRLERGLI